MKFCTACNGSYDDAQSFCPRDGEVLQESPEDFVGRVIDGKYQIESFIAQGGMGALYLARHILLGDRVVIKTLRSEMRNNAEWLKRFQREGKAARAFRHPNSVTVYDLSAGSDGLIYMVMEYVEGHTLDKELKRRSSFTPHDALEVLEPVADVLDAAHARGVVHRDLKPENIMLGRADDGHTTIKVLDLGIAKMLGAGDVHAAGATSLTVAGQILGTPYYMSPEQWGEMPRDGNPEVDARTDIYSLGVIFFELVAGRKPLGGSTLSELRQKHVRELPSLQSVAPDVPEAFSRAIMRAMAKDRADRPQNAGEFIEELRAAVGLPARSRARIAAGLGETGQGTGAQSQAFTGNEARTANLPSKPDVFDQSRAETLAAPRQAESHVAGVRETAVPPTDSATSGNVAAARRDSARETVASRPFAETRLNAPAAGGVQQASSHYASQEAAVPAPDTGQKRSPAPLIAGGALALLLVVGVGGWLAWSRLGAKTDENVPKTPPTANAATNPSSPTAPAAAPKVEAMSYWIEAFDKAEDATGARVADTAANLKSGQRFRFHFNSRERGYLYMIAPGAGGNALMTILTAQGAGQLKSNLVAGNADFVFPFGGAKLKLDDNPGAEDYTVIFSPSPLMSPSFLAGKFLHELTPAEVKELEDFRARHKSAAAAQEVKEDGPSRRVAVSVPETVTAEGQPIIFDIRVNHK